VGEPPVASRVAAAVADGETVSWPEVERLAATPAERALIRQLRHLSALAGSTGQIRALPSARLPRAMAFVLLPAVLQVAAACLALAFAAAPDGARFRPAQALLVITFAAAALILRLGGRRDRRAQWLMAVYLLSSASFAHPILAGAAAGGTPFGLLHALALDAFLPYALWRFAQVFPHTERFTLIDRAALGAAWIALAAGVLLVINNLAAAGADVAAPLERLARDHPSQRFWDVVYPLALAALVVPGLRTWRAAPAERRRVRLFALALVAGALPLFLKGLLQMLGPASLASWMSSGPQKAVIDVIVLGALVAIPPATTYAVLARQALTVRVVVHRATTYLLARAVVTTMALLPAAGLARYAYLKRDLPLGRIVSEGQGLALAWWLAGAIVLLLARRRLAALVDRWFLSRGVDYQRAVAESMAAIREAGGPGGVAAAVAREIARVFGAPAGVLRITAAGAVPLHGDLPPVPRESTLLAMLRDSRDPSVVGTRSATFDLLTHADRAWVTASGADVLLPLHRADGTQVALVAAAPKPSGLPWSAADLSLLATLGEAAGLALEGTLGEGGDSPAESVEQWAIECVRCGAVSPGGAAACACGAGVQPALLPATLQGKFTVERRVGAGGMGVVYRGRDLTLGRAIALKTLPGLKAGAAERLHEEARAMAALIHPNLALIFGAETWRRTPVLVMEFLDGGTLADRLRRGRLPIDEAVALARTLAGALAALHGAALVHGDVKPSNIGFTAGGVPKLLDFGLARLREREAPDDRLAFAADDRSLSAVGGTPLYLPPEAFGGARPSAAFDLWALAVVLFESLAGANPFAAPTLEGVRRRIGATRADVRDWRPDVPAELAGALRTALSRDAAQRPGSALEFLARV
jgi:hypothetical protein